MFSTPKTTRGYWTYHYALTATEAKALGLPVKVGMPLEVMEFMKLYPQPIRQSGVEYLPIDAPVGVEVVEHELTYRRPHCESLDLDPLTSAKN